MLKNMEQCPVTNPKTPETNQPQKIGYLYPLTPVLASDHIIKIFKLSETNTGRPYVHNNNLEDSGRMCCIEAESFEGDIGNLVFWILFGIWRLVFGISLLASRVARYTHG